MKRTLFEVGDFVVEKGTTTKSPRLIISLDETKSGDYVYFLCQPRDTIEKLNSSYELFVPDLDKDAVEILFIDRAEQLKFESPYDFYLRFNGIKIPLKYDHLYQLLNEDYDIEQDGDLFNCLVAAGLVDKNGRTTPLFETSDKQISKLTYAKRQEFQWTPTKENIDRLPEEVKAHILRLQTQIEILERAMNNLVVR